MRQTIILLIFAFYSVTALGQSKELTEAYQKYRNFYQKGDITQAIVWAKKALQLEVKEFGKNDLGHAATLNNLATIYQNNKQYDEAIPLFEQAATIFKTQLGETHRDYGTLLNNLAVLYENKGLIAKAEPLYIQVLNIRKANQEEDSPKYLEALANLAGIQFKLNSLEKADQSYQALLKLRKNSDLSTAQYAQECIAYAQVLIALDSSHLAEQYFRKGIEMEKNSIGTQHIQHAHSLSKLASLYENQGKYAQAEPLYTQSSDIFKSQLGNKDTTYAASLINLAILFEELGKYEQAEHHYEEALLIYSLQLGEKHPKYAQALSNKAGLYIEIGDYSKSELLYQEALEQFKKIYGEENDHYSTILNNMAILYEKMGKSERAELLYQQILSIYKKGLGKSHPNYALVINNLASLLKGKKAYKEAEPLYKEALAIKKTRLGVNHPEYAISLNNLASLYKSMGKLKEAEPLYKKALAIKKDYLGEAHPEYAISINNLAALYEELRAFEQAEPLYLKALSIIKRHLGQKHPSYATTLNNLAVLYESMGRFPEAESYYIQANQNLLYQIQYYFPYLNENSRKSFWDQNLSSGFAKFYHFAEVRAATNPQILGHAYDYRLATKALLLDGTAKMRNAILKSNDPGIISQYNEWLSLKNSIAQAYTLSKEELTKYGWDVRALEREASKLESNLSRESSHFNQATQQQSVTWRDVQRKLKEGEAALEIIRISNIDVNHPVQYLVIIIKASQTAHPEYVLLNNGEELESKFTQYYRNCISYQIEDQYSYKKFWEPISDKLAGIKKVYVSSDGVYNKINLSTLRNPTTGQYLAQELTAHLVTNTRELTTWEGESSMANSAFLLGHPSYQIGTLAKLDANETDITRSSSNLGQWFDQMSFDDLPGTEQEIIKIAEGLQQNDWNLTIKLHESATEEELKQVSSPSILHIATHGFFIPSEDMAAGKGHTTENPMLRSGLVLAGVENYYSAAQRPETEDGILTAYEATTLFLDKTELVVLSACETGLGETKDGEGVYGLQRAFKVAGAKTILMSLWKVNDEATQNLMSVFYKNWLQGDSKREAFLKAQQQIRSDFPNPYYWGAFVMVGE